VNVTLPSAVLHVGHVKDLLGRARALILDVDGTLAETEEAHRQAFNEAFVQTGLDWCWGRTVYKQLLRIAGGKERIRAFDRMRQTDAPLSDPEIAELHRVKTMRYVELVSGGGCPLRPGVEALLAGAEKRGQRLAIATTTSRANIDALLRVALGQDWGSRFTAIVAGEDVPLKKPAPDVYFEVLARLGVPGSDCIAIEDSSNGLVAATLAGIPVVITRSVYFRDEDFSKALIAVDDLIELSDV
jgi:HAD superfamily hydrolase (TIGR01509 family)